MPWATGEYTKLKLLESPLKVVKQAKIDADVFCAVASGEYYSMINDGSLNDPVLMWEIQDQLDSAYCELHDGLVDQAKAKYAKKKIMAKSRSHRKWKGRGRQMALYGSALTNYSTAQLQCQMVSTELSSLNN